MCENEKFILEMNIIPRGIIKWSAFDSLEGYRDNISKQNDINLYEHKPILDEQLIFYINLTLQEMNFSSNYYIRFFKSNHIIDYKGLILNRKDNALYLDGHTIDTNDILWIEKI